MWRYCQRLRCWRIISWAKLLGTAWGSIEEVNLLEKSCELFGKVLIPELVYEEAVQKGKNRGYEDAVLIEEIADDGLIEVKEVKERELIDRANDFNIQAGEAEAAIWEMEKFLVESGYKSEYSVKDLEREISEISR